MPWAIDAREVNAAGAILTTCTDNHAIKQIMPISPSTARLRMTASFFSGFTVFIIVASYYESNALSTVEPPNRSGI